jgi:integrase
MNESLRPTAHTQIKGYDTRKGDSRYLVRYRKADGRSSMKRGFRTIKEAKDWLSEWNENVKLGSTATVSSGRTRVTSLWPKFHQRKSVRLKRSSLSSLESSWSTHVEPRWGTHQIANVAPSDVQDWINELSAKYSPSTVIRAVEVLRGVLDIGVRDGLVFRNQARDATIELPRKAKSKAEESRRYLSHTEVDQLAGTCESDDRALIVYITAYCGLRFGELNGLRVDDWIPESRRLYVRRAYTQDRTGQWYLDTPKSHQIRRVPVPPFIASLIDTHVDGRRKKDRMFTRHGGNQTLPLPYPASNTAWSEKLWLDRALAKAGIERLTIHDLRHTAASLAVQAGAHVKVIQKMLGHADASETLNTYADLFDEDLDHVAERLDKARRKAAKKRMKKNAKEAKKHEQYADGS